MKNEFYAKLVDLYAGRELPTELERDMELAAAGDNALAEEMAGLRQTVDLLREDAGAPFTDESYQRVLMKMYARGGHIEPRTPEPAHLQYHLPIQG